MIPSINRNPTLFFAAGFLNLAFLMGGLFSGVRSEVKVVGPALPAKPPDCQIEVLQEVKPERPFEIVAQIDVYVRRNKVTRGRQGVFEEALPELKKQACRVGADGAMVIRQTVSHSGEFKLLYVKSEAFRYTGPPPAAREGQEKQEE
ncbi:MAG: hypothetical protein LAO21_11580 [Acidobacteriia bacterium]|nr:hypothetical protein [Terriglobia bacterium]